jgi:hypothetical protein
MWVGTADTLDGARLRVAELGKSTPAEYIVMNQRTGDKVFIKSDAHMDSSDLGEVRYPSWETKYLEVLREKNTRQLFVKVTAAETAIVERLREIKSSSNSFAEKIAIQEASNVLLAIKTGKLNFPTWEPSQGKNS